MKSLKSIYQRLEQRRERLEKGLKEIVRQLKGMGALKIILFGSLALNRVSLCSDLDILAIMPNIKSGKEWLREIYQKLERYVASDIIVFNLKEYKENRDKNLFLKEIEKRGKVIYEKGA